MGKWRGADYACENPVARRFPLPRTNTKKEMTMGRLVSYGARSLCYRAVILARSLAEGRATGAEPLAEKYLLDGKLAEGTTALEARLKVAPTDAEAKFGLGVVQ